MPMLYPRFDQLVHAVCPYQEMKIVLFPRTAWLYHSKSVRRAGSGDGRQKARLDDLLFIGLLVLV